jgi:hypothetical protein
VRCRPTAFVFSCTAVAFGTQLTIRPSGRISLFCLISLLAASVTRAQITINEVLADNRAAVANGQLRINEWMTRPASGDDWLEVFNSDNLPVKLDALVTGEEAIFVANEEANRYLRLVTPAVP